MSTKRASDGELKLERFDSRITHSAEPHRKRRAAANEASPDGDDNVRSEAVLGPTIPAIRQQNKWSVDEDNLLREAVVRHSECNWKGIASEVVGRSHVQCLQRWKKALKPGIRKGHWTLSEDEALRAAVSKNLRNWGMVANLVQGRTSKQCRERWQNHLSPCINHQSFLPEEDQRLQEAHQQVGCQWAKIAQVLPGRSQEAIKIRWRSLNRLAAKSGTPREHTLEQRMESEAGCGSNGVGRAGVSAGAA